jgi:hypothetical protein
MPVNRNAIWEVLKAPFMNPAQSSRIDYAQANGFTNKFKSATQGNPDILGAGVTTGDKLTFGGAVVNPYRQSVNLPIPLNGDSLDQTVFIAPYAMTIVAISEVHSTAGDDSGAVTLNLTKDESGIVPGAGVTLMDGTFNLKGTAATVQNATLATSRTTLTLAAGDRIGANFVGTITTLAGVVVTLYFYTAGLGDFAIFRQEEMGIADCCFYIANRPMKVAAAYWAHSTLGTNGGAVTAQVTKDTSTNAPGAGTDLLTNNTNAGFNLKSTINVVQTGTLTATAASLILAAGDRISIDFAGTTTAVAGGICVVVFEPWYAGLKDITITCKANADCIDQYFWTADRAYRIVDARYVNATAGNDGGSVDVQITVDDETDAAGAGVDVLNNNTAAGFDCKTTANTVVVADFISEAVRYVNTGNRLSLDFAGTVTTLAGVCITVTVQPV